MERRQVLKLLGGTAGIAALGAGARYALLPPSRSGSLSSASELAIRIYDSLDATARKQACVDYDHPLRQYHNRGVNGGGLWITPLTLGWEQRQMMTDLLYAGLSEAGQSRIPHEYFLQYPGVHLLSLLICGNPKEPPYQIVLTGPHLNLRIGGASREGVAFGGPLVYGDQRGDSERGLPGNLYRYQFEMGDRLFQSLRPEEREAAVQAESPIQTMIDLLGSDGKFAGVSIAALSAESKALARTLIDGILSTYPAEDVAYAWKCLEANGGIDGLWLSYYREGDAGGGYQIFRLEGPAAIFYFRGYPHVHAFINIGMDGDAPLSVGEVLGINPAVIEKDGVKRLFEAAMRHTLDADFAYYDVESVVGRLRVGSIRTGDIYTLESWQNRTSVLKVRGSNLHASLIGSATVDPNQIYSVATIDYVADHEASLRIGEVDSREDGMMLRDATISYLQRRGFS